MKTLHSPDGIAQLMENLWLRHSAGLQRMADNIYMVDLPPLTEEEQARLREDSDNTPDYSQEELFGGWI